ncbi:hypothetical protein C8R46DRAFT_1216947 [Mycena filopes]|nr:hypothetical protein C8R46DRAFT_1216947 [Mycena filopes]
MSSTTARVEARMEARNPLCIPELLRLCLEFVSDTTDLRACSLVSRFWVDAAQSYLFREVDLGQNLSRSSSRWDNCRQTLNVSTHLIQHVRGISIRNPSSVALLTEICSFPFSHLEDVNIALILLLDIPAAVSLQKLLAVPTLRRVKLFTPFLKSPTIFLRIWERTSRRLQHLDLMCHEDGPDHDDLPISHSPPHIGLKSLRFIHGAESPSWIAAILSPFDLSGLVALSVGDPELLLQSPVVDSLPGLKLLELSISDDHEPIDLALLPQLEVLYISIGGAVRVVNTMVLAAFSSIRPASRIRDIGIRMWQFSAHSGRHELDLTLCEDLDLALSGLSLAHPYTVTFEIGQSGHHVHAHQSHFPRLMFSNRLLLRDGYSDWFQNLVSTLQ